MSEMPVGAQLSEDGAWWWDGGAWQPVGPGQAGDAGEQPAGYAMFDLMEGGIGVMPDPDDNPDNHVLPHHESGTRISFAVLNVGNLGGNARVGIEVDGSFLTEWESRHLEPGESEDTYVALGRLAPGEHTVLIYVNPGSGRNDHTTNTFTVE